jgi:hypothetical protein
MDKNIVSANDAGDLLTKLLDENVPLRAFLQTTGGLVVSMRGFVSSITVKAGLTISEKRPFVSGLRYFSVPIFDRDFICRYGDKREFPEAEREKFIVEYGDAAMVFSFADGDFLALFFTL